jgi:hypothetical protein
MKDPRAYLDEIQSNLEKIRHRPATPVEAALFGMIDGLAGLQLTMLERLTALEQVAGIQPATARRAPARRRAEQPAPDARPVSDEATVVVRRPAAGADGRATTTRATRR